MKLNFKNHWIIILIILSISHPPGLARNHAHLNHVRTTSWIYLFSLAKNSAVVHSQSKYQTSLVETIYL